MRTVFALVLLGLLAVGCTRSSDGQSTDGSARSDRFVVYFGVMPAALSGEEVATHAEPRDPHRPAAAPTADTHHFVVAVFDAVSGERIGDATLRARHVPPRGMETTKALEPMRIGKTLSYGNTFLLPEGRGHHFEVDIRRGEVTDRFTFTYDNLH